MKKTKMSFPMIFFVVPLLVCVLAYQSYKTYLILMAIIFILYSAALILTGILKYKKYGQKQLNYILLISGTLAWGGIAALPVYFGLIFLYSLFKMFG